MMLSTYEKVSDVLESVCKYHEQLAVFYANLIDKTDQEDVRMCLLYMKGQEENLAHMRAEYLEKAPAKIRDTWMQYGPDQDLLTIPDAQSLGEEFTIDDLVDLWRQLTERLWSFYLDAEYFVDIPEIKELFRKLKSQKEDEKAKMSKDTMFLERHM
jgi:hypothetical protein